MSRQHAGSDVVSRSRLQFLDTMRGVAILGVFIYHAIWEVSGHPMSWKNGLWNPVGFEPARALVQYALQCCSVPSMFFLISGYLIHRHQCNGRTVDLRYTARRNLRLYLPFLVVLVPFTLLYLTSLPPRFAPPDLQQMVLHTLLVFVYFGNDSAGAINPSFWFVSVEIQLSFAYLGFRAIFQRFGWRTLMVLLLVIELAARVAASSGENYLYATPFSYPFTWMLGAWLAQLQSEGRLPTNPGHKAAAWWAATVLATGVQKLEYFASLGLALAAFYFIAWLLRRELPHVSIDTRWNRAKDGVFRFVRLVGAMSLWAYLINQPVLFYVEAAIGPLISDPLTRIFVGAFIGWLIVLPLSWALLRLLEPQLVRLIDFLITPPPRTVAVRSPASG